MKNNDKLIALFEDHDKLLWARAHSWNRTTGIDVEELYAECRIQFFFALEKFEEGRGMSFSSFLSMWINSELQMWVKKNFGAPAESEAIIDLLQTDLNPADVAAFKDLVSDLSPDAQYIYRALVDAPETLNLKGGMPPKAIRGAIRDHLRDVQWSWNRIWDTFKELKAALA